MSTEEAKNAVKKEHLLFRHSGVQSYYIFPVKIINNMIIGGYCNKNKEIVLQLRNEDYYEYTYISDCELVPSMFKITLCENALLNLQLKKMGY